MSHYWGKTCKKIKYVFNFHKTETNLQYDIKTKFKLSLEQIVCEYDLPRTGNYYLHKEIKQH